MAKDTDKLLAAGFGSYFGKSEEDTGRLDAAASGNEFVKKGLEPAVADPNADRTTQCVKEHGEGFYYDPSLEMCSYRQE